MAKEFNYIIARPWNQEDITEDELCIYSYGSEIQRGTMNQALESLKYVKTRESLEDAGLAKNYSIYKVKYKKVK